MRLSVLSVIIVVSSLLLFSLNASALHHEETGAGANAAAPLPDDEGVVVEVLDTTGYTYMELESGDRRFWIAAPTTEVKPGDHIRFVRSMSMENFTSKTLNRTFRRVIFVTSTMVKN